MNYKVKDTMLEVNAKDRTFKEFMLKVQSILTEKATQKDGGENWNAKDTELHEALLAAEIQVRTALSTNFNTNGAIDILVDLIAKGNAYIVGNPLKKGNLFISFSFTVSSFAKQAFCICPANPQCIWP